MNSRRSVLRFASSSRVNWTELSDIDLNPGWAVESA
jgi:hypothetical protein